MADETIPVAVQVDGFEQACGRFYAAMNGTDRDATFIPLFDALNWAVSIDDRFQSIWKEASPRSSEWWSDGFAHGDTVKGVRFARNRVHHQWADALWLSLGTRPPRQAPGEWRWRPDLSHGRSRRFETEYGNMSPLTR
jgi:hypothetical protein